MELKNKNLNPIFIIGSPRSGTTLLRLMLSAHSDISIPHEFPLVKKVIDSFDNNKIIRKDVLLFVEELYKMKHFLDWRLNKKELVNEFKKKYFSKQDIINLIYNFYLVTWPGDAKKIWGDKNIGSIDYIEEIIELFPKARFVHIIRDGRDVSNSLLNRKWNFYSFTGKKTFYINHIIGAIGTWNEAINIINYKKNLIDNDCFFELSYENLLLNPETNLKNLCSFCNVDFQLEMLNYYKNENSQKTIPLKRLKDTHENIYKPILKENTNQFKKRFTKNQLMLIEKKAKNNFLNYGYKLEYLKISLPIYYDLWSQLSYSVSKFIAFVVFFIKNKVKIFLKRWKLL